MRVIAGSAGGIPLRIPSHEVRATMDRVRGAVFSALGERVLNAIVLDLFAGSGAFGIEALSRGAARAVFVDNHRKAIEMIRANLEKTRLDGLVIRRDVFRFLESCDTQFNIIFADPPYVKQREDRDFAMELCVVPALKQSLAASGVFVLEQMAGRSANLVSGWRVLRARQYGATEILFLALAPSVRSPE
jgi:16S rRNA (guanine966-N2)-methyltransferase